jgi:quercetin dioxygenase-like cupin family protein
MNASLHTIELPPTELLAKPILNQNGFTCTQFTLVPGADTELPPSHSQDEQMLIVLEGEVAVLARGVTTLLKPGAAMLMAPGKAVEVSARAESPVRLLRVEIPPRQIITPQIISLGK